MPSRNSEKEVGELEEKNDALEEQVEEFVETLEALQSLNDCQNRMISGGGQGIYMTLYR